MGTNMKPYDYTNLRELMFICRLGEEGVIIHPYSFVALIFGVLCRGTDILSYLKTLCFVHYVFPFQ